MTAVEITFCRDVSLFTLAINDDNVEHVETAVVIKP